MRIIGSAWIFQYFGTFGTLRQRKRLLLVVAPGTADKIDRNLGGTADRMIRPMCLAHMGFFA